MRVVVAAFILTAGLVSAAVAQEFTAVREDILLLTLSDGRMATLQQGPAGVTVRAITAEPGAAAGTALDIAVDDVIAACAGVNNPTVAQIRESIQQIAVGSPVVLTLRRAGRDHTLRFPRQEPRAAGRAMTMTGPLPQSGWVTAGGNEAANELQIAGARIRDNTQGMPEVVSRGSHPAAAAVPLRTGDVIVEVNGKRIAALAGLTLFYTPVEAGGEVALVVMRAGREETIRFRKPAQ